MRLYTDRMATKEEVLEVLRQVEDPELGMDIVDLGLLYDVEVENSTAKVTYSLTSMGCPAGPLIAQDIDSAIRQVEGIQDVELELTFDPLAGRFPQLAKDSVTAGITKEETPLGGLVDLTALNAVLRQAGKPEVDASGLDKK